MTKQGRYSLVLFDGVCNLCNGAVRFLLRHDRRARLRFASLQSSAGQEVLRRHGLPPEELNSFLFIENGRVWSRSAAALRLAHRLGGMWRLCTIFSLVPAPLRDAAYNLVATHRYHWFGRSESCPVPTADDKKRFLS